jgi:16S rRNA (cytosine1402-N4)-methyltransferase
MFQHIPIMVHEVVDLLKPEPGMVLVDGTIGGAGHGAVLLSHILPDGFLIGLDQDMEAIQAAQGRLSRLDPRRYQLVHGNFREIKSILEKSGYHSVDGILLDIGVSSHHLDTAERGFSFRWDAPLDMRMDQSGPLTAGALVNQADQKTLERILWDYGEERWARRIAAFILEARGARPIETTGDLVSIVRKAIPQAARQGDRHFAARVFMALRMAVNQELEALKEALDDGVDLLNPGGRMAVIAFHSLEDRLVKDAFKQKERGCVCPKDFPVCRCGGISQGRVITKKPVLPKIEEVRENPRARSAKLRVFEKRQGEVVTSGLFDAVRD